MGDYTIDAIDIADAPRDYAIVLRLADNRRSTFVLRAWARNADADADRRWTDITAAATTRWLSSDPAIVAPDENQPGVFHARRDGRATISAQDSSSGSSGSSGNRQDAWVLESRNSVLGRVGSVPNTLPDSVAARYLIVGITFRLEVNPDSSRVQITAQPADGARVFRHPEHGATNGATYWYVTPLRPGSLTIRAEIPSQHPQHPQHYAGSIYSQCSFPVYEEPVALGPVGIDGPWSGDPFILWLGSRARAFVYLRTVNGAYLEDELGCNVRWSSSAPDVLSVEQIDGRVEILGRQAGRALLVAECLNARSSLQVDVCEEPEIQWF